GEPNEITFINTIMVDIQSRKLVTVWFENTEHSASSLDLILVHDSWYLLLAQSHQACNVTKPLTASSQLFVWENTKQTFKSKGKFMADCVTSGIFLKSTWPVEEYFLSLAQLRAAEYPIFEENYQYSREVI
ncbi:hypothetical protein SK128_018378, partial [Halocaridina rubra]